MFIIQLLYVEGCSLGQYLSQPIRQGRTLLTAMLILVDQNKETIDIFEVLGLLFVINEMRY
jgi:hypothetical protein